MQGLHVALPLRQQLTHGLLLRLSKTGIKNQPCAGLPRGAASGRPAGAAGAGELFSYNCWMSFVVNGGEHSSLA